MTRTKNNCIRRKKKELQQKNEDIEIKMNNTNNELSHAVNIKKKHLKN